MRRAALFLVLMLVASFGVSGCLGPCACPNTGGSDAGPFVPSSYSATDVQTALATCELPHGPVVHPATYRDKRALLVGAWVECPPPSATIFHPAIAFRSDGAWRHLMADASGGLVPDDHPGDGGTYSFLLVDDAPTNGNADVTVTTGGGSPTPETFSNGPTVFESSPTRLYVAFPSLDAAPIEVWLVPLPGESPHPG